MLKFRAPPAAPVPSPRADFIAGALSDYCTSDHEEAMGQFFESWSREEVPGVGHYVHAENRSAFLEWVQRKLL